MELSLQEGEVTCCLTNFFSDIFIVVQVNLLEFLGVFEIVDVYRGVGVRREPIPTVKDVDGGLVCMKHLCLLQIDDDQSLPEAIDHSYETLEYLQLS